MTFDLTRFLADHFRGGAPGDVVASVRAAGVADKPPSEEAVRKWKDRNSITGENLAILLATLEKHNGPAVALLPYLEGADHA